MLNQVQNTYDAWGLLERHAIDVNSAVGASGSVDDYNVRNTFVQYGGVGGGAGGANVPTQLRRTDQDLYRAATLVQGVDMLYLNTSGTTTLMDDDLGRVTRVYLPGPSLTIAEYRYLGLGTVVETDLPGALVRSRLHTGASPAAYTNKLDRWNRPVREHWQTYDASAATLVDFVDVAVTLNAAGNALKRDGSYYPIEDAKATYDNLGRLTSLRHGTLDGSGNIPIADGRREDVRTFTQAGTVAAWDMDLNFQFDGTTAFAPNYTDLEETKDTRTLNLLDKPTARDTNSDNGAQPEYTIAYDKLTRPTSDGLNYEWVYDGFGRLAQAKVKTGGALVKEFAYDGLGRVIGERYDTDATAGVGTVAQDPWYFKAYDGFSRHVATFRGTDASPKEMYTHHEFTQGGSQLAVRRDVDATGGGGWGGSSDGVLETQAFLLHRANGDVIAVVGGLTVDGVYPNEIRRPGLLRERMEYVPGGDGAGSVEPMRLSPSDGYQIGGARGADGLVTGDDYTAFTNDFAAGTVNSATDLNNNGAVDSRDFWAWNAEFDSGALVGRAIMSVPDGADAKGPGNVRGAMAAAGVALDAVLSGKVSGGSGQTGRVRWAATSAIAGVRIGVIVAMQNNQRRTVEPWIPGEPWVPDQPLIPFDEDGRPFRQYPIDCKSDTDPNALWCMDVCDPSGDTGGIVYRQDATGKWRCCICTQSLRRRYHEFWKPPGDPLERDWQLFFANIQACTVAHEREHMRQPQSMPPDCRECYAWGVTVECLKQHKAWCFLENWCKWLDKAIKDAEKEQKKRCNQCDRLRLVHN